MMYSPIHYKEERSELVFDLINEYGFATIITQFEGEPLVSHLPLILDPAGDQKTLLGHFARANPHWKNFFKDGALRVIFQGPQSYISPAWYQARPENVPTWNYATVHIQGQASIISDPMEVYEVLFKTVQRFENKFQTGWALPPSLNSEIEAMLGEIVAFRIEIKLIQAKFKLSQMQDPRDRLNVIDQLPKYGQDCAALADYMKRVMKAKK